MKIGSINIDNPLILAPMENVTDTAFRLICKRLGADILFTEFTSCEALIRNISRVLKKVALQEEEHPVAIQLFGSVEESMQKAAVMAEKLKPDFIDINCGCWVKNHVTRGEGAGLLRDLPRLERIVAATVKATKLPVTVKTRLGWDTNSIVILEVAKIVEQAGAKALTVHCRTRNQAYKGKADWSWLEKIKKTISIPLIGNGDVTCGEDAKSMLELGCDGVMIGRGAITNPWIFSQIKYYLKTGKHLPEPGLEDKIKLCIEHLQLSVKLKGERNGVVPFRKYYGGYLKGIPNISQLRADLMQMINLEEIINRLNDFKESV